MPRLFSDEEMSEGMIIEASSTGVVHGAITADANSLVSTVVSTVDMPVGRFIPSDEVQISYDRGIIDELLSNDNSKRKSSKRTKQCIICNSKNKVEEVCFQRYTNDICSDCKEKYIGVCRKCHGNYSKERLVDIFENNEYYCVNCLACSGYRMCHHCKKWKSDAISIHNNFCYCRDCLKELNIETFHCHGCGRYYLQERYGKNNHCITCVNSELREVRNYSYKPEPRFFKVSSEYENLYLGVELEMGYVEEPSIVNDFVAEYSNSFFYMKKDTSIPIYGCEIVTQPATLRKHIGSKYWKPLLEASKEYGFNANNDKCGIHVHVSKDFFTADEISLLDCFVNSYSFWKKLARRVSHYSEYVQKDEDSWGRQTTNRRCALNLSNNETVEFRIFKGTLEYEEVMAYLEACHAASLFVKSCTLNILDTSDNNKKLVTQTFIDFIEKNKYTYLNKYCYKFKIFE